MRNETEILYAMVMKKGYVYVRDRPAVTHLMYDEYKKRKNLPKGQEIAQCPFVISYVPFFTRKRAFGFSKKNNSLSSLFDPQ